jgi:hypothetical protein
MITKFTEYLSEKLIPNVDYFPDKTSLKQIAAGLKYLITHEISKDGDINLDYGGGKYDLGTNFLKQYGVTNLVYDKFSRSEEHNNKILQILKDRKADTVTLLNVINVIEDIDDRIFVIKDAYSHLKVGGYMLIMVYAGTKKKSGLTKSKTWQENRKLSTYLPEIQRAIPNVNDQIVRCLSKLLLIHKTDYSIREGFELKTKQGSTIKRYKDVGKKMGDDLYFHKKYINEYVEPTFYNKLKSFLPEGFKFNIIKYNEKNRTISFINSPDFDRADEPIVGDAMKVTEEGQVTLTRQKTIPQIYHHKWLFVKDDYQGFDIDKSKERSERWLQVSDKINMSKIGTLSYWQNEVLPLLESNQPEYKILKEIEHKILGKYHEFVPSITKGTWRNCDENARIEYWERKKRGENVKYCKGGVYSEDTVKPGYKGMPHKYAGMEHLGHAFVLLDDRYIVDPTPFKLYTGQANTAWEPEAFADEYFQNPLYVVTFIVPDEYLHEEMTNNRIYDVQKLMGLIK